MPDVQRRLGLPSFERPKFADSIRMPENILDLEPANITDLIAKFTEMLAYVTFERARCEAEITSLLGHLKKTKVGIFITRPGINNQEKWKRDSVVDSDENVLSTEEQISRLKSEVEIIRCYCDNYERYVAALSRDLTRRKL